MAETRSHGRPLQLAMVVLIVAAAAVAIVGVPGLPVSRWIVFGVLILAALATGGALGRQRQRVWDRTADELGLSREEDGSGSDGWSDAPRLTGTHGGRSVSAWYYWVGEGRSKTAYTRAEAEASLPDGYRLALRPEPLWDRIAGDTQDLDPGADPDFDDAVAVSSTDDETIRHVLTADVRSDLEAVGQFEEVVAEDGRVRLVVGTHRIDAASVRALLDAVVHLADGLEQAVGDDEAFGG